ncbi:uncharacterized protein LOC131066134 [Cryptomeria japonica]|uniref:uncharacterized protein LOC131066134 n=1 Tax=Cryptomeria japonica TaxID=3369 RepID=UPI0025ABEBC8|nr:uncharacterized protein LOC131066134 [Cryptomeria japonica]
MCEWKDVETLPLSANQKEIIKGIMQEYTPMLSTKEDTLRWCGSKLGQYSMKIGYSILDKTEERKEWPIKLMWSSPILPKARVFTWLALKKRILTWERLRRLGFLGPLRCIMCKKVEESLDHLLLQCEEAQTVWSFLLGKLGWMAPLPNTILDLFSSWNIPSRRSVFSSLWLVASSLVVWEIWKERNKKIFQEKEDSTESLLLRVQRAIAESVSAAARNHNLAKHPYTSEDRIIQANWPLVNCQPVNGSLRVNPPLEKEEVKWDPPTKEWIKINFDGVSRGNPGTLEVGVVARDDKGVILFKGA